MDIEHISISRYGTFKQCQLLYKYKYHLKQASLEPEPFYFIYGKIIHKIAEIFVENQARKPINEIGNAVLNGEIEIEENTKAPTLPSSYKERYFNHIKNIDKITNKIGIDGLIEHKFSWDLEPDKKYMVTGVIDRLIEKNNSFFILDYKTTKKGVFRKTQHNIADDLQLRCYARAIQRMYNVDAGQIKAALYYLEDGEFIGAKFSNKSLLAVEAELLKVYKQIYSADPNKITPNPGPHCDRCGYKSICPFSALR